MKAIVRTLSSVGKVVSAMIVCGCAVNTYAATVTSAAINDSYDKITGSVSISVAGESIASGDDVAKDAEVTVMAESANEGKNFSQWVATGVELSDEQKRSNPLTFTMVEANVKLVPIFDGMWIYNESEKLMRDASGKWHVRMNPIKDTTNIALIGGDNVAAVTNGVGDLDLSTAICDTACNRRTFTHGANNNKFVPEIIDNGDGTKTTNSWVTSLILPYTFAYFSGQMLNCDWASPKSITNLVINTPNLKGTIDGAIMWGIKKVEKFVFKVPNVTRINQAFRVPLLNDTDVGVDWDLSSLTNISWTNLSDSDIRMAGTKMKGILRLPKIQTICSMAFLNSPNLEGVELGVNGMTLTHISTNAFGGTTGIKKAVIGGAEEGLTLSHNAFTLANGLTQVYMIGSIPQKQTEDAKMFGANDSAPLTVCFYAPRNSQWQNVFDNASEVDTSSDAYKKFIEGKDESDWPVGVIEADLFGTKYQQFIGVTDMVKYGYGTKFEFSVPKSNAYGDTITCVSGQVSGEVVNPGTIIELRAEISESGASGFKWLGIPEGCLVEGSETSETIKIKVDSEPINIKLWVNHPWVYVPSAEDVNLGVISNAAWQINVKVKWNGNLHLGNGKANGVFTSVGEGILDLSTPIYNEARDREYVIDEIGWWSFASSASTPTRYQPATEIVFPTTITAIGDQTFNCPSADSVLTNIVMNFPEFTGVIPDFFLSGRALRSAVIKLPKAQKIRFQSFSGVFRNGVDASDFEFNSILSMGSKAFQYNDVSGCLHLQSITNASSEAVRNNKFTDLEIGTGYTLKYQPLLVVTNYAFAYNQKMMNMVIGPYSDIVCNDPQKDEFIGNTMLTNITFLGRPPSTTALDNLVQSATLLADAKTKNLVIRGSYVLGWDKVPVSTTYVTGETEPEVGEKETVAGVYVSTKDNSRRAWIVYSPSPLDPKGTLLIIR